MKRAIRLTAHMALQAILIASLVVMPIGITGCTSVQVQDSINVAAQVVTSAASIVSPVSPEYGALLSSVGANLKEVGVLYSAYTSAAAADKPGIAGKLHAALLVISGNLANILATAHIKAPALVTEIGVAVAIVNTTLTLILNHLPAAVPAHAAVFAQTQALPVIGTAKSAGDLAKAWNNAVGEKYPQAVVNAPQRHKKLGMF